MTDVPEVKTTKTITEERVLELSEEKLVQIIKEWAINQHGFSHRSEVVDDEYFFRGVVVREKLTTTQIPLER